MLRRILSTAALSATLAFSEVHTVQIVERADVLNAKSFGNAGSYEKIIAKVHFQVDPKNRSNQIVADIALAPRNQAGKVEFSADLYVLRPRDPAKGNGTVFYEVPNRGGKGMMSTFDFASGVQEFKTEREFGDGFLLQQGYTLVWLGWQFDLPNAPGSLRLYAPVATEANRPITGLVRSEFIPNGKVTSFSLGDRNMVAYPVANPNDPSVKLTVRDRCDGQRTTIPRAEWKFSADSKSVEMATGFVPGKVYEVVYTASNPALSGLGLAGVRDLISYFKYGGAGSSDNPLADESRFIRRAIGFGTSQSGRFLREFLYDGFNRDERNRKVFDGIWAHVAGGGRGSFNQRFAQPSRDGHPHGNCVYPTDVFPFTDARQTDADTKLSLGLLDRAAADKVTPRIFYTNGAYEYWGRTAATIHTSVDGKQDIAPEPGTRIYLLAGTQHGAGTFPPARNASTQNLPNGNDYRWQMRALLTAMQAWVADGKEPPASMYPLIAKDQLVTRGAVHFPAIPNSSLPQHPLTAFRLDFGAAFRTKHIATQEPPRLGKAFTALLPQVDMDGTDAAGIRAPMIQVPLATYTGWNLRVPGIGASEEIYSMIGSTFYFPRTRAERAATKDPRLSIEERYRGREGYLSKFEAAARDLARRGYLLEPDVAAVIRQGGTQWDAVQQRR